MVKKNNMIHRIIPIRGDSLYTVGIHDNNSIDLAFIDGDHSYEGCLGDLRNVLPKMKNNGNILAHDCIPDSECLKAVQDFTKENGLTYKIIPTTWGMAHIKLQ